MSLDALILSGAGVLILWTSTVVGFVMWFNGKFNELMPMDYYDKRHRELEGRLRELELWRAAKDGSAH